MDMGYLTCDIYSVCRICLSHAGDVSIFTRNEQSFLGYSLANRIMSFTNIEIAEDDGLPSKLCLQCLYQVNQAFKLKVQCEFADGTLRQYCSGKTKNTVTFLIPYQEDESNHNLDIYSGGEHFDLALEVLSDNHFPATEKGSVNGTASKNEHSQKFIENDEDDDDLSCHSDIQSNGDDNLSCGSHIDSNNESIGRSDRENTFDGLVFSHLKEPSQNNLEVETPLTNDEESYATSFMGVFVCKMCSEVFVIEDEYKIHISPPHPKCSDCGKEFCQKTLLHIHRKSHKPQKKFICSFCGKAFTSITSLNIHERKHEGFKCFLCPHCGKMAKGKREHYCSISREVLEKNHPCEECGKMFVSMVTLRTHKKRHSSDDRFQCKECKKRFFSNQELDRHVRVHKGVRPFACLDDGCTMTFYSQGELNRHMRYHNGVKNFICDICDHSFYESSHLASHKRKHTGEKPYKCSKCPKSFVDCSKLKRHSKIHVGLKCKKNKK